MVLSRCNVVLISSRYLSIESKFMFVVERSMQLVNRWIAPALSLRLGLSEEGWARKIPGEKKGRKG